jgi:hypothetical protein
MLPSDKPVWMACIAGFASYQVMTYFIYELYEVILRVLEITEKVLTPGKEDSDDL